MGVQKETRRGKERKGEKDGGREGRKGGLEKEGKGEGAPQPTKTELPSQNRRKEESRTAGRETS